ncbi:MAG: hypothetical protein AB8B91_07020, partial [Rubripirellula sp.]
DAKTGQTLKRLSGHATHVNRLAFSNDRKHLSSAGADGNVLTYDLNQLDDEPTVFRAGHGVTSIRYLQDDSLVVATFMGTIQIVDPQRKSVLSTLQGHRIPALTPGKPAPGPMMIRSMSVSPDGGQLITVDDNGMVYAWPLSQSESAASAISAYENQAHWNVSLEDDILKVGSFQRDDEDGRPYGWDELSAFDDGLGRLQPRGNGSVTISTTDSDRSTGISTTIEIPQDTEYLTFVARLRGPTLAASAGPLAESGVSFGLIDGDGKERVFRRLQPSYKGYRSWLVKSGTARVLPGETHVRVKIDIANMVGGLEVDDIRVIPSSVEKEATSAQLASLKTALRTDDANLIEQLIQADPKMLELRSGDSDNGTPLTRTAWVGAPRVAAKLLELGAEIEAKDWNWGNSPLRWCGWWGTDKVAEVLLKAGAEIGNTGRAAQASKTSNGSRTRPDADFDRVTELVEQYEAANQ